MTTKIYKLLKFIGKRGLLWLGINISSGIVLAGVEALFSVVLVLVLKSLGILSESPMNNLYGVSLEFGTTELISMLILLGLVRGGAQFLAAHSSNVSLESISVRLRLLLFYDVFRLRGGFLSLASMQTKISEIFPKATSFCQVITQTIPAFVQATVLFIIMFRQAPREMGIGLSGVIFAGIFIHWAGTKARKIAAMQPNVGQIQNTRMVRATRNFFLLKALRTLPVELEILQRGVIAGSGMSLRILFIIAFVGALPQVVGALIIALLIFMQLHEPQMNGLAFLAFLYIFMRFVQNLALIAGNLGSLNATFPALKLSVQYFFTFPKEVLAEALWPASALHSVGSNWRDHLSQMVQPVKPAISGEPRAKPRTVEFKNVVFQYNALQAPVVEHLNLKVNSGAMLAIVGPSGSGKSTILALILGILKPTSGNVLIEGVSPDQYFANPSARVGYVGAEPFLIEGTVRENLLYGRQERHSDEDLWNALGQASLSEWLRATPEKLDLRISENGEGLSTGQKQRLSLARALVGKQNILILDEISANLDAETEAQIASSVNALQGLCTIIIVSHREGMIRNILNRIEL